METIQLRGVSTNNLRKIDVSFPLGKLTCVTGVSGSGKSSLVFDTLYGESYRRYVESLSSFARQYMKTLPKPDIADAQNLPPAIAIKQQRVGSYGRSTVGSMTELDDLLRILFTYLSVVICPDSGQELRSFSPKGLAMLLLQNWQREPFAKSLLVAAPLDQYEGLNQDELRDMLLASGFTKKIDAGGSLQSLEETPLDPQRELVMLDRFRKLGSGTEQTARLMEAIHSGFKLGHGVCVVVRDGVAERYWNKYVSPTTGRVFRQPSLAMFNPNNPYGACPDCRGFGDVPYIDPQKVLPDDGMSLMEEGVAPWNFGTHRSIYRTAMTAFKKAGFDPNLPFADYTKAMSQLLWEGSGTFPGINGYFSWLETKAYKTHYRIHYARFRSYQTCTTCGGSRISPDALCFYLDGKNFADVLKMPITGVGDWVNGLSDSTVEKGASPLHQAEFSGISLGLEEAIQELLTRIELMAQVGIQYLAMDRQANTLSGGELQRINIARSLGSALTATLFCLDEPTTGLHPRDTDNLVQVIRSIQAAGNTVVIVEHDPTVMKSCDWLVEIGPEAGALGGRVTFQQTPDKYTVPRFDWGRPAPSKMATKLHWKGVRTNNLQGIDVSIPVGVVSVVCGVSGGGKTSLVEHTLYPLARDAAGLERETELSRVVPVAGSIGPKAQFQHFQEIELMNQKGLGRSSRSNLATYLDIWTDIRKLLAATPDAKALQLTSKAFSFNSPGGRCETCRGLGTTIEDMSFLGDLAVICTDCHGKRFNDDVLSVRYRDLNVLDILGLTVAEAAEVFLDQRHLVQKLERVSQLRLSYLTLGQPTSSLSGGEAQRLKLLGALTKGKKQKKGGLYFFDEPSVGLSEAEVFALVGLFRELCDAGSTVVVVEHHLGLIQSADWVVELGPEAGEGGGQVIYMGAGKDFRGIPGSQTTPYID